jgi:lia operon protein LiaG
MPRFPVLSLFPIVLLGLPAALRAQQPLERYTIDDDAVAIYNLVGGVRLEPGEGGVAVQMTRAGADAGRLRVAQGEIDGRATLRVLYPEDRINSGTGSRGSSTTLRVREDGTFGDTDGEDEHGHGRHGRDGWEEGRKVTIASGGGLDARADLVVRVSRGHRVAIYLAVGSVTVTNVEGDLTLDTHEAEVTANGVKGRLGVDVGSGSVRATQIEGDLSVDTGSGSVEVSRVRGRSLSIDTGSGDVTGSDLEAGELSVDTGSGSIRLAGVMAPDLSLETGSGSVTAELRRDIASLHVETGSGDIAIRAPASLGAEVEIETSSGDIETDFPLQITRHARDHMVGTIGDGKGTIAIETGSGGVKLLKGSN